MEEYKSEFVFELIKPLSYHDGGESKATTETLILKAPSNKQSRQTAALQQGFFRAVNSLQKNQNTSETFDEKDEVSGREIMTLIMMSDVDLGKYQETFRDLLLNGIAFVNDTQKMTRTIYDNMSTEDSNNLIGEYLSIFLLSSSMKASRKK